MAFYCLLLQNGLQSWHFAACCDRRDCSRCILKLVVTNWTAVMGFYCLLWQTSLSHTSLQPLHIIACSYKIDCNHGNLLFVVTDQLAAVAYHCLLLQNGLQSWHFIVCCYKIACSHGILLLVVTKRPEVMTFYGLLLQNGLKSWHLIACSDRPYCSRRMLLLIVINWILRQNTSRSHSISAPWHQSLPSLRAVAYRDTRDYRTACCYRKDCSRGMLILISDRTNSSYCVYLSVRVDFCHGILSLVVYTGLD